MSIGFVTFFFYLVRFFPFLFSFIYLFFFILFIYIRKPLKIDVLYNSHGNITSTYTTHPPPFSNRSRPRRRLRIRIYVCCPISRIRPASPFSSCGSPEAAAACTHTIHKRRSAACYYIRTDSYDPKKTTLYSAHAESYLLSFANYAPLISPRFSVGVYGTYRYICVWACTRGW